MQEIKSITKLLQEKDTFIARTEEIGGGSMLTEFGLCYPNISDPLNKNTIECNRVLDLADLHFQSWTYWDYGPFWNNNGELNKDLASLFSRPYPLATSGIPRNLVYDFTKKEFKYEFLISNDTAVRLPTEIFVPPMIYPNHAFEVELSNDLEWKFSPVDSNIILITQTRPNVNATSGAFVKIRPDINISISIVS